MKRPTDAKEKSKRSLLANADTLLERFDDHQKRTRRNQVDEPGRRMLQDCVQRAHGDFVVPGWGDGRPPAVGKVVAVLIRLQRKAFARPTGAGDLAFPAFDSMSSISWSQKRYVTQAEK